eukprot:TRINITY_DN61972_c0_g1_i1.p2 TRINITY_DN61972_c0_g1~~TRINITY_DN61972_c0_g1_i1.p2  ORF type:complete len:198 (+),score=23.91 TRINITY_DN61972_c0_g1_i1:310-903(+)
MGFTAEAARSALEATGWEHTHAALDRLAAMQVVQCHDPVSQRRPQHKAAMAPADFHPTMSSTCTGGRSSCLPTDDAPCFPSGASPKNGARTMSSFIFASLPAAQEPAAAPAVGSTREARASATQMWAEMAGTSVGEQAVAQLDSGHTARMMEPRTCSTVQVVGAPQDTHTKPHPCPNPNPNPGEKLTEPPKLSLIHI